MQTEFTVFMPVDAIKSVGADSDEPWVFEGIASTADMDLYGEVVYPQSFKNSVEFFKSNGKIFFDHEYAKKSSDWLEKYGYSKDEILALKMPIGRPLDAEITEDGLKIKAILNKSHPMSSLIWNHFLNNKDENFNESMGLSIGAKYLGQPRREYDVKKGQFVTYLPDLLLYEVSMTPEPVNPYTKTWASVLKSLMKDAEQEQDKDNVEYHTITPDDVVFDPEKHRLAIKSTVQGGDGITHVFESYIDLKEDVTRAMADKDTTLKAASPDEDQDKKEENANPFAQNDSDAGPEGKKPEGGEEAAGADADAGAADAAPEAPQEEGSPADDGEGAPDSDADMADEGAEAAGQEGGGILDSLVEGDEGDDGEDMSSDEDASMKMVLDKLDTLLDAIMQLVDMESEEQVSGAPGEGQVSEEAPNVAVKGLADEINSMKSAVEQMFENVTTVNLSEDSTRQFGEAIKGVFDGFEDRVVEKIVQKLQTETVVTKSVNTGERPVQVVHPGVNVDGSTEEAVDTDVRKSVGDSSVEEAQQMDTLKSLVSEYLSITGYDSGASQKRGRVITKATNQLGISQHEFRVYVRKGEKGQL